MLSNIYLGAVDSLVVRTSDSKPEDLGSMPPNTLLVHTEYVLVKSVGPKVLWAEITSAGNWRICLSPSVSCLNFGGGDRWCRHLSSLWEFYRAKSYCHLYGDQGQHLIAYHDEFRGPRSD
ncbi:uncharacterized protein TNCV_1438091 [Trichonephila clavipes]|nr:uncharacterized protein TNCV_1438091 [Trichonephila clavipes]